MSKTKKKEKQNKSARKNLRRFVMWEGNLWFDIGIRTLIIDERKSRRKTREGIEVSAFFVKSNFYIFNANRDHHFFRQINIFTKEVTKELISRKKFEHNRVTVLFHSRHLVLTVEITEIYCHATVFWQIFLQIKVLLKNFTVNWFDEKYLACAWQAVNFLFFHTVLSVVWKLRKFTLTHFWAKISWK